jgi:broad specificity phosphatase PhoE
VTRVLLVRHGQSEWNADGRWQGQADPPLTDLGRAQAHHAARSLGVVDAILSSDLVRALDTAMIVAGELGVGPVVVDPDLRERHAGDWQGLTRVQIEDGWPGYLDDRRRPDGWEADDHLLARATAALVRVHELVPRGEAIAITHGGLVYVLEGAFGEPFERLPNLAGRWVEVGPEGPTRLGERVVLVDPDELTIPSQI